MGGWNAVGRLGSRGERSADRVGWRGAVQCLRKGPAIMEGRLSAHCPLTRPGRRAGVLSGGLVTRCGPDCPSLPVADLRRCLPHPPQRASRGDQLRLPGDKHVDLAKDSGGRNGVPTLRPLAGFGAHVGKQAEEGQGLASQTWLTHARACTHTHTHTPHRLEESLAQLTQTVLSSVRLSTTGSALNGGHFMQKLEVMALSREGVLEGLRPQGALPRLSHPAGSQDHPSTPAITGGCPPTALPVPLWPWDAGRRPRPRDDWRAAGPP